MKKSIFTRRNGEPPLQRQIDFLLMKIDQRCEHWHIYLYHSLYPELFPFLYGPKSYSKINYYYYYCDDIKAEFYRFI